MTVKYYGDEIIAWRIGYGKSPLKLTYEEVIGTLEEMEAIRKCLKAHNLFTVFHDISGKEE